jgi:hypothetical protein
VAGKVELLEGLLRMLPKAAQRVDLGDMTRPVTATRLEALKKMVPKADDWGWKGGKMNEITGNQYIHISPYYEEGTHSLARRQLHTAAKEGKLLNDVLSMPTKADTYQRSIQDDEVSRVMSDFALLENADIPREWTGKIVSAFGGRVPRNGAEGVDRLIGDIPVGMGTTSYRDIVATKVSDIMRPMTNDQRETFIALLPEWSGSLDELADAARSL